MSPCLQLELLGDFRLRRGDQPLTAVNTARLQSLIAYLAQHRGTPQPRSHIAFLFWPDSSEKQAQTNLRHLLHKLRSAFPESGEFVRADHVSLRWDSHAPVTLDVAEFVRALGEADEASRKSDEGGMRRALESAVALYRGDLLPSCTDDWIAPWRETIRREFAGALERLIRVLEDARDYVAALRHARRLQQLEPTRETTACTLMRLHVLAGDRAAALQVYKESVAVLQRELAVGPGAALREMHTRVLSGETMPPVATTGAPSVRGTPELPLHGRHAEWKALRNVWTKAAMGHPHLLTILGEAGIGKSRLAEELCVWVERQGGAVARTRSYAAEGRLPFAPAAQWLRSAALRPRLAKLDPAWRIEVAQILPEEPGIERTKIRGLESKSESWRRHRLFEGLSRAILAGSEPVLLLLDDLQWTDHETLEWLGFLLRFAMTSRLLVVGTIRTEELRPDHPLQRLLHDLRRDDQVSQVQLGPLSAAEAALVAMDIAGRNLSGDEASWLYQETEGNPLFVVEQVRAGMGIHSPDAGDRAATGRQNGTESSLPPKVYAVITTRLAQLSPLARELAVVTAVVGRVCSLDLLSAVSGHPHGEMLPAMEELMQRRILRETAVGAYDFTHDKLRDVTYAEASAPRRLLLHRRTAEILEKVHQADPEAAWAQVAAHFEAGGMPVPALAAYRQAAEAAKRVHANDEAVRLFQKALALVPALPTVSARAEAELELNTAVGVCLVASHGYTAAEVKGIYERANELCHQLGRPTEAPILRALAIASLTSGDLRRAESLGHELLAVHAQTRDPVVYVEAHYVLGVSCFWLGRFAESRTHLEESISNYDSVHRETHLSLYAQDPKAVCLGRLAWTLWYLGFPDQARQRLKEALALVRELKHPHTASYALYFGAQFCLDARDDTRAMELLTELAPLPHFFWEFRGRILQCFLAARRERTKENLDEAEEHMAMYARVGNLVIFSAFFGYKAQIYRQHGKVREGLAAIADGFAVLERIDERHFVPELHRLRGELLVAEGADLPEAEMCFQRALQLAREQQAKSSELRAAMSLGRLWEGQKKRKQARELVAGLYAWFSEGFESADLLDARALLDQWK